jgi:hypothetical protein
MNTIEYPGSASQFRAFMEIITNSLDDGIWHPGQPESLKIAYEPSLGAVSREGWIIRKVDNQDCCATLMASEYLTNNTVVYVHDGILFFPKYEHPDWGKPPLTPEIRRISYQTIGKSLDLFIDEITSRIAKQLTPKSLEPQKPKNTRDLDIWFKYYYECKRAGIKFTLKEISKEANYNEVYVRQCHLLYKAEHHSKNHPI